MAKYIYLLLLLLLLLLFACFLTIPALERLLLLLMVFTKSVSRIYKDLVIYNSHVQLIN
jgi:hypothetical protein